MKKQLQAFGVTLLLLSPLSAFAHETQHFMIGSKEYKFVIGSLNEPVTVDDKTGVDLTVSAISATGALMPVSGLEQTLKVELRAGGKKKEMNLTTQYGKPGGYKAVFYPTVQTTLTYRVFGTIGDETIDLSFSCNPAGHVHAEDHTEEEKISDNVTRTLRRGAFGCPVAKADLGFPEPAPTLRDLSGSGLNWGIIGTVLGAVSLALTLAGRRKKS